MKEFPVRIYAADVRPLEDERLFAAAYERVTEDRRKKVDQIKAPASRRLSLTAELLLLYGLSQLENSEEVSQAGRILPLLGASLRYRYGENGKPYLENYRVREALLGSDAGSEAVSADIPGSAIYFNLSHSANMAVCAIAPCEVGCDIEKIRGSREAVARRFFAPGEYERIMELGDEEARSRMFCRFWTLKESFLKVTGEGLRLGLDSFQIIPGEEKISVSFMPRKSREAVSAPDVREIRDPRCGEAAPQTYYFREYEAAEGYCCAACAVRDDFEPQVRRADIRKLLTSSAFIKTGLKNS